MVTSSITQNRIGYLRIAAFTLGSAAEARREMSQLAKAGARRFILDFRFNKGGLAEETADVLKLFIGRQKLLFSERSDKPAHNHDYTAAQTAPFEGARLVVLVNGQTASYAEAAAASLRENFGAMIIGSKTSGEAGIQRMFPLAEGKGLWMTIAYLTSPSGKQIEDAGVIPDVTVSLSDSDELRIARVWNDNTSVPPENDTCFGEALRALSR